jgi:DDE superfamily endonuclease
MPFCGGEKMTPAWAQRQAELLSDCIVSPDVFESIVDRLRDFAMPYQHCLETEADKRNVPLYLAGLLSHLDRKNAEAIAALVDVERQVIQAFMGTAPWDHRPLIKVLVGQVVERLGEPDGVIAFDPSSFPKRGIHSVGVKRQWCSHRGENRPLSGGGVHGVCVSRRSCLARLPIVPSRGLGARQAQASGMSRARGCALPHPAGAVLGNARSVG